MGLVRLQFVTLLVAYGTRESASFNLGEPFVLQRWHLYMHPCHQQSDEVCMNAQLPDVSRSDARLCVQCSRAPRSALSFWYSACLILMRTGAICKTFSRTMTTAYSQEQQW